MTQPCYLDAISNTLWAWNVMRTLCFVLYYTLNMSITLICFIAQYFYIYRMTQTEQAKMHSINKLYFCNC